jgi:hypothetical protein
LGLGGELGDRLDGDKIHDPLARGLAFREAATCVLALARVKSPVVWKARWGRELPAEKLGVKSLGALDIVRGNLEMINGVVHGCCSPLVQYLTCPCIVDFYQFPRLIS